MEAMAQRCLAKIHSFIILDFMPIVFLSQMAGFGADTNYKGI